MPIDLPALLVQPASFDLQRQFAGPRRDGKQGRQRFLYRRRLPSPEDRPRHHRRVDDPSELRPGFRIETRRRTGVGPGNAITAHAGPGYHGFDPLADVGVRGDAQPAADSPDAGLRALPTV